VGAGTDAGTGASADAGTGADGFWLSEGKVSCARKTPARAQSARMKTHIRPAKDIRLHEWEAQLMGIITIEEGNGGGSLLFPLSLNALLGTGVDMNRPVL
jgi:hypothetical protein